MLTLLAPCSLRDRRLYFSLEYRLPHKTISRSVGLLIVPCTRPRLLLPAFSAARACRRSRPAPPALVRWSLRATICSRHSAGGRCLAASGTAPTRCSYCKPDNVCRAICTSTSTSWYVLASGAKNLIRSPFYKSPPMEVRAGGKKGHRLFRPKRVTNEEFTKKWPHLPYYYLCTDRRTVRHSALHEFDLESLLSQDNSSQGQGKFRKELLVRVLVLVFVYLVFRELKRNVTGNN